MALQFHPKAGAIVIAQFPDDFLHGEMEKRRPVIIVSRHVPRDRQTCATVVPISTTAPHALRPHHVIVPAGAMPRGLRERVATRFAKCLATWAASRTSVVDTFTRP